MWCSPEFAVAVTGWVEDWYRQHGFRQELITSFIAPCFQPWSKEFELTFFQDVSWLYGWRIPNDDKHNPAIRGFVYRYIYQALPSEVLQEMERLNPRDEEGRRKKRLFQLLTEDKLGEFLRVRIEQVLSTIRCLPRRHCQVNWHALKPLLPG
jgi:hypothetical protein